LRSELADLFAYLLTLANDSGIDLEQAYVDKMGQRVGPDRAGGEEAG
jgi:NTP pyrophosphatase (non-canonical NTP hydrolase)